MAAVALLAVATPVAIRELTPVSSPWRVIVPHSGNSYSITVSADGHIYTGKDDPVGTEPAITEWSPAGHQVARFGPSAPGTTLALASDHLGYIYAIDADGQPLAYTPTRQAATYWDATVDRLFDKRSEYQPSPERAIAVAFYGLTVISDPLRGRIVQINEGDGQLLQQIKGVYNHAQSASSLPLISTGQMGDIYLAFDSGIDELNLQGTKISR